MKLNAILVALLFSLCISCQAQPAKITVKIINGLSFKPDAVVTYQVSGPAMYYYVGVEKLLDNQWREIVLDVTAGAPDRGAVVRKLTGGKPVTNKYLLKGIPSIYIQNGHTYRLKVTYGVAPDAVTKTGVSSEFQVK